jgi:hypothetical protein
MFDEGTLNRQYPDTRTRDHEPRVCSS